MLLWAKKWSGNITGKIVSLPDKLNTFYIHIDQKISELRSPVATASDAPAPTVTMTDVK